MQNYILLFSWQQAALLEPAPPPNDPNKLNVWLDNLASLSNHIKMFTLGLVTSDHKAPKPNILLDYKVPTV